jgi:hypothetical protein
MKLQSASIALALATGVACLPAVSCVDTFERRPSNIDRVRLLAIRAEPAEARPGESVQLTALVVGSNGIVDLAAQAPKWSFCLRRPAAAAYNAVADECGELDGPPLVAAAIGTNPSVKLPIDGCKIFGSEPPPPQAGEPPIGPGYPDTSGGFYQPLRLDAEGAPLGFGGVRIRCALFQAAVDTARDFRDRYVTNRNPDFLAIELANARTTVAPGESIEVVGRYAPASRERYVVYEPKSQTVQDRVETLKLSWFTTRGSFSSDATAASSTSEEEMRTVYTAPNDPGVTHLYGVLRDERGGVSYLALDLEVR